MQMDDTPNLCQRQAAFAEMLGKLLTRATASGLTVKISQMYRSLEQEKAYVASGASQTLHSKHLDGLAVDLVIIHGCAPLENSALFRPLGEYWESLGGRWGGRFGYESQPKAVQDTHIGWDAGHFEYKAYIQPPPPEPPVGDAPEAPPLPDGLLPQNPA